MRRIPQWVVSGMTGRPVSLEHPSIMHVGTAMTSEVVTPADTEAVTAPTTNTASTFTTAETTPSSSTAPFSQQAVTYLVPQCRIVQPTPNISQVLKPALQPGEAWPLPEPEQALQVRTDKPVARKLSKNHMRMTPDGNGRRGKKSVAPMDLPNAFGRKTVGRRATIARLESSVNRKE